MSTSASCATRWCSSKCPLGANPSSASRWRPPSTISSTSAWRRRCRDAGRGSGTPEFGLAFETWLLHELRSWIDYRSGEDLRHWRSTSGFEVDFILGDHTAIEVKGKANVSPGDLKALRALAEEKKLRRYLCVCLEPRRRRVGGVDVLPYGEFLEALWGGEYR